LCAIIDLHTRFILSWEITAQWCTRVLQEDIEKHGKPEIFNTDQGSQYKSETLTDLLKDNDIKISMDGKCRAIDTIVIEKTIANCKI